MGNLHYKWWLKIDFDHQSSNDQKLLIITRLITFGCQACNGKFFFNRPFLWRPKFKRGMWYVWCVFGKPSTYDTTPFFNDKQILVTIKQWRCVEWWSNFFNHHPTHHTIKWKLKKIDHSKGHGVGWFTFQKWYYMHFTPPFGDQKFLVAIWHTPIVGWWQKGVGLMLSFWKKNSSHVFPLKRLKNFSHHPMVWICWMVIKILWSPSNNGVMLDGD